VLTVLGASLGAASCALSTSATLALSLSQTRWAFWLLVGASVAALWFSWHVVRNLFSFSLIFMCFFLLYGLVGPTAAIYGTGLAPVFSRPYATAFYLHLYALATFSIVLGMLVSASLLPRASGAPPRREWPVMFPVAITLAVGASASSIANFLRAGGVSALASGKGGYAAAVAALPLTIPEHQLLLAAFGALGLSLARAFRGRRNRRANRREVFFFGLAILPGLALGLVIGIRGWLLSSVMALAVGSRCCRPVPRISYRLTVSVFVAYLGFVFLFTNRTPLMHALASGDLRMYRELAFDRERLVKNLNPANNEFGAPFGDVSEFTFLPRSDRKPKSGESYIDALVAPIPGFLYPGAKPQQIIDEFRDKAAPTLKARGRIPGTAFSPLLEAYWNFRSFGVLVVFFLVGSLLPPLERLWAKPPGVHAAFFYLMLLPLTFRFHRSGFAMTVAIVFWAAVFAGLSWAYGSFGAHIRSFGRRADDSRVGWRPARRRAGGQWFSNRRIGRSV